MYGCNGFEKIFAVGPYSNSFPRYMTATLWLMYLTTLRSCAMNRNAALVSFCRDMRRVMIFDCTETSRADTASSAMMSSGESAIALAIAIRCLCPPLNCWGYFSISDALSPTLSRSSFTFSLFADLSRLVLIVNGSDTTSYTDILGSREDIGS